MAKVTMREIQDAAIAILVERPEGVRFMELVRAVQTKLPDANPNAVWTQIGELPKNRSEMVFKPSRGVYQLKSNAGRDGDQEDAEDVDKPSVGKGLCEESFYEPFSDYLKGEEEMTEAAPLGGGGRGGGRSRMNDE